MVACGVWTEKTSGLCRIFFAGADMRQSRECEDEFARAARQDAGNQNNAVTAVRHVNARLLL
jgi:hypothetical protein